MVAVSALGIASAGSAFAQDNVAAPLEVNLFGGGSFFKLRQSNNPFPDKLVNGGIFGAGITWNFARWIAAEGTVGYGTTNLRLYTTPGVAIRSVGLGDRLTQFTLGPVFYLAPPESRLRPFLTAGIGYDWFRPTDEARRFATNPLNGYHIAQLDDRAQVALFYGGGLKADLNRWFGLRMDLRGLLLKNPHFNLPGYPTGPGSLYIKPGGTQLGLQITGGVFFKFGSRSAPVAAPVARPTAPMTPQAAGDDFHVTAPVARTIDAGCAGTMTTPATFSVTATDNNATHRAAYQWMVDGVPAGDNSPNFSYAIPQSGRHTISIRVTDVGTGSIGQPFAADLGTVTVQEYAKPTVSASANPSEIFVGDKASLSVTGSGACGGNITYACTAPEGTVSGNPPSSFDSTGVAFDMTNRERLQTKTVNISCTASDEKGGSGSATVAVTVKLKAIDQAVRPFDDIVFPANNTRVNNCAKKLLLENLYPYLTQHPEYTVVLIGHLDANESKGKRALDKDRALNVAAALTGGSDTCQKLDRSRVKVDWVGADQTSDKKPHFCAPSTTPKQDERAGSSVSQTDPNADSRRVEIWLVPNGAPNPKAAKAVKDLPTREMDAKGCPK